MILGVLNAGLNTLLEYLSAHVLTCLILACFVASVIGALRYMPTLLEVPIVGTLFGYNLLKNVEKAVQESGVEAEIVKVDSIEEIMNRGIMMTPGLYIDGKERAVGRVPSPEEIKKMLKK
jgi:small redox-active disulfide protein 2